MNEEIQKITCKCEDLKFEHEHRAVDHKALVDESKDKVIALWCEIMKHSNSISCN